MLPGPECRREPQGTFPPATAGHPPQGRGWLGTPLHCRSTSLEALKSLLPATGHWQDFAHLELQGAWDLFATTHTDPQGMGLLAR